MIKNLLSDTLKYGVGRVILKFFSVLIVPIIAKNFPPDIFGEINIVTIFTGLFLGITVLGLDSAIGYFYYHGEEELKSDYLGSAFIIRIVISIITFFTFVIFAKFLAGTNFLLKDSNKYMLIILGAAAIPFDNSMSFFIDLTRFLMKPIIFNIVNISKIIIYYILIIIFLLNNLTVEKVFISILISSIIPSLYLLFYYKKIITFKINLYCLKRLLKYGLPLMPASIMFFFMNSANRFVLNLYTSLEDVGIFSLMNSVSSVFLLITSSIIMAWTPYAMVIAKRDDAKIIFARITTILIVILIPLAFLFWSITDYAILLLSTPLYLKGGNVIIFIILQSILNLLYYCVAIGLTLKEKTIYLTIGYSIAALISVLISFPLCNLFGIFGAALSSFIGYLVSTIYVAYKSQKFYYIPYKIKIIITYVILSLFLIFFSLFITSSNLLHNFLIRFLIGCSLFSIPFFINILSINDIKNILIQK